MGFFSARSPRAPIELERRQGRVLVVGVHGFGGQVSFNGLRTLLDATFPDADRILPYYLPNRWSNLNPLDFTDALERSIVDAHRERAYERIVLVGHSMGAVILRKAVVWACGQEDDRPARRGVSSWIAQVERFVSLAGVNRGWSLERRGAEADALPIPRWRLTVLRLFRTFAIRIGRAKTIRAFERGAPFVADLRVQWIRAARAPEGSPKLPLVLHILGSRDGIVSRADSADVNAAKDVHFLSLPDTDHAEIAGALTAEIVNGQPTTSRARRIVAACTQAPETLEVDKREPLLEDNTITRIVYVLHGIRDYGVWARSLAELINDRARADGVAGVKAIAPAYGWFPMAPFLLWSDRQVKVRRFMDEFTEHLARCPFVAHFDFIGHSNGTYVLASAMRRYATLRARYVYFAGSVVPIAYDWSRYLPQTATERPGENPSRLQGLRNVVATRDWVVALFPRFYEQLSEWLGEGRFPRLLDIGAAGFRGFRDTTDPAGRVRNIEFTEGSHGAGVDIGTPEKREALVRFGVCGLDPECEEQIIRALRNGRRGGSAKVLEFFSNVSWLVWMALVAGLIVGGVVITQTLGVIALAFYVVVVAAVLNSA